MKSKILKFNKSHELVDKSDSQRSQPNDAYNPLEAAKDTAMVSTLLGTPQTVAQSYKEIIEYDVDEELKRFPK